MIIALSSEEYTHETILTQYIAIIFQTTYWRIIYKKNKIISYPATRMAFVHIIATKSLITAKILNQKQTTVNALVFPTLT